MYTRNFTRVLLALSVCLVALPARADTMTLQNGARIKPYPDEYVWDEYPYWGCEDATLDAADPDLNFGGSDRLSLRSNASPARTVILFENIERAIGSGQQITDARLVLHVDGDAPASGEIAVYRLLNRWADGTGDGVAKHWAVTHNSRFHGETGPDLPWAVPGAASAGDDRAASFTVTRTIAGAYDPGTKTLVLDGLAADTDTFYNRQYTDFGWVVEFTPTTPAGSEIRFHSAESEDLSLRPELRLEYSDIAEPSRAVDLTVTHIERFPEYYRYRPEGAYTMKSYHDQSIGLMDRPGYATDQKWPENGETVTFRAHVKNKGLSTFNGSFTVRWRVNDSFLDEERFTGAIAANGEAMFDIDWTWQADHADHRDVVVECFADADDEVAEHCENNNVLRDYVEGLCFIMRVHASLYDLYDEYRNAIGSYGFEDYVQWHFKMWNELYCDRSRFPDVAPDGILERMRVQEIVILPDATPSRIDYLKDGAWNWSYDAGNVQGHRDWIEKHTRYIEGSLIHELSHQVGLIDLYQMHVARTMPDGSGGGVRTKDGTPYYVTRSFIDLVGGGIMAGGDARPWELYSSHSAAGLNTNLGYRRGFYGEYLYDLPSKIRLRPLDSSGSPIPDGMVRVWQARYGRIESEDDYGWQPILDRRLGADGAATMTNYETLEEGPFTTLTGHTLSPNPWGRIDVVGGNGLLLVRVDAYGQRDYRFEPLHRFNIPFWAGQTGTYTHDVAFQIAPREGLGSVNYALSGTATAGKDGSGAWKAVDGNPYTEWFPGTVVPGDWWKLDLGSTKTVGQIEVVPFTINKGDWMFGFRVEASETGAFAGEQETIVDEDNWHVGINHETDIDPDDTNVWWVTYRCYPTQARYLRVVDTIEDYWIRLAEFRVFGFDGEDTVPPAAVDDLAAASAGGGVSLTWTAPGDDADEGVAKLYDIRWSAAPIDAGNFDTATPVAPDPPRPWAAGIVQETTVSAMLPGELRYFAMRTMDHAGNWSEISNVASATAPGAARLVEVEALPDGSVRLRWEEGAASSWDVWYADGGAGGPWSIAAEAVASTEWTDVGGGERPHPRDVDARFYRGSVHRP